MMKSLKAAWFLLLLFTYTTAAAQDEFTYTYEGSTLKYRVLSESALTCEVIGAGDTYGIKILKIPSAVKYGRDTYTVTTIGYEAFKNCYMTSVIIPGTVTSIGDNAFDSCDDLASVTIPKSVTNIGEFAFVRCYSLTSVTIPEAVTSLETGAFEDCSSLTSVTIPKTVTSIGSQAFKGCNSLTSVIIPNAVTSIGHHAFFECKELAGIIIGSSVREIGNDAFCDCPKLQKVIALPRQAPVALYDIFDEKAYQTATLIYGLGEEVDNSYGKKGAMWWKFQHYKQKDLSSGAEAELQSVLPPKEPKENLLASKAITPSNFPPKEPVQKQEVIDNTFAGVSASFPGGETALWAFIAQNVVYPEVAQEQGLQGRVILRFKVDVDGSVSDITVRKSLSRECDAAAVSVIKKLPRFTPAKSKDGQPVPVWFNIPVTFRLM